MALESFLNHPLLIWEWLVWSLGLTSLKMIIHFVWNKGKKKGLSEFDEYKKWKEVFKEKK